MVEQIQGAINKMKQLALLKDINQLDEEIEKTQNIINLYKQKLTLLKQHYEILQQNSQKLECSKDFFDYYLSNQKLYRLIHEKLAISFDKYQREKQKLAQQNISQKQFMSKVMKKVSFNITYPLENLNFINTFQYKTIHDTSQNYMIFVQLKNNSILFYDFTGYQIIDSYTPKHQIHQVALSPRLDEVIVTTLGVDNTIQMMRMENKKIRINNTANEDPNSPNNSLFKENIDFNTTINLENGFNPQTNDNNNTVNVQNDKNNTQKEKKQYNNSYKQNTMGSGLSNQYRIGLQQQQERFKYIMKHEADFKLIDYNDKQVESIYSSIIYATIKGIKFFLLGDKLGHIHTYYRNGTYKGTTQVANQQINHLIKSYPNTVFSTKNIISSFNALQLEVPSQNCDIISDGILEIQFDPLYNSHMYILTEKQEVLAFEMKTQENTCHFKQKIHQQTNQIPQDLTLIPIKNNLIVIDKKTSVFKVYNTTDVNFESEYIQNTVFEAEIYKPKYKNSTMMYRFQKGNSASTYLLIAEQYENITDVILYEIFQPQKQEIDFINNVRGPILICAALCFVTYQYCQKQKSEKQRPSSFEDFNLKSEYTNQKKNLNDSDKQKLNKYQETLNSLANKSKQLSCGLNLQQNRVKEQNYNSKMLDIDDIDHRNHMF